MYERTGIVVHQNVSKMRVAAGLSGSTMCVKGLCKGG